MPTKTREVRPSPKPRQVLTLDGILLTVPKSWSLLPPGDAALSRRIKKDSPTWTVKEQKGRRLFSKGIWAPSDRIEALRAELVVEREDPAYQKKLDSSRARRAKAQTEYAADFTDEIYQALAFHASYRSLADDLAKAIAAHAVPVGSGTVARTKRIPIEERAQAAIIAWMRHQTTDYDTMSIPLVKGKRREIRRKLAARSRKLLARYQTGEVIASKDCLLRKALAP